MINAKQIASALLLPLGLLFIAALFYFAWDADKLYALLSGDVEFSAPERPCDLNRESCSATLPGGQELRFSITPRPIPVLDKLTLSVEAPGLDAQSIRVDIYGTEMNMGRYTYTLHRDTTGLYVAKGIIPSCTPKMTWRTDIIIEEAQRRYGTYFTFTTR